MTLLTGESLVNSVNEWLPISFGKSDQFKWDSPIIKGETSRITMKQISDVGQVHIWWPKLIKR